MDQEKISKIYLDGRHYDQLYRDGTRDQSFWINQAKIYGDPILEITCGTGRVTIALAQAGFKTVGLDRAEGMLKEAERKSVEAGISIEWVRSDMRNFDLDTKFPLILLPGNALCHLLDLENLEACLRNVRNHLTADGHFIIDVFVPNPELLISEANQRYPFSEYADPDGGGKIIVTHSFIYQSDTQIKRITTHHTFENQKSETTGELNMRMYFPQELDALLKYNGFEIEYKYGNYDLTDFDHTSEKQLIICRLAQS